MRHEAKLNMFKRAAGLENFKNIALSLAFRHQRFLCYELSTGRLLDTPIETGPCSDPSLLSNEPQHVQECLRAVVPGVSEEVSLSRPTWVKKNGLTFKHNCYVIIGSDGLNPIFGGVGRSLPIRGGAAPWTLSRKCVPNCGIIFLDAYRISNEWTAWRLEVTSMSTWRNVTYQNRPVLNQKLRLKAWGGLGTSLRHWLIKAFKKLYWLCVGIICYYNCGAPRLCWRGWVWFSFPLRVHETNHRSHYWRQGTDAKLPALCALSPACRASTTAKRSPWHPSVGALTCLQPDEIWGVLAAYSEFHVTPQYFFDSQCATQTMGRTTVQGKRLSIFGTSTYLSVPTERMSLWGRCWCSWVALPVSRA